MDDAPTPILRSENKVGQLLIIALQKPVGKEVWVQNIMSVVMAC
jgi:hypothetical protein